MLGKEWRGGRHACAWWFVARRGTVQAGWGIGGVGVGEGEFGRFVSLCVSVGVFLTCCSYACVSMHCVSI